MMNKKLEQQLNDLGYKLDDFVIEHYRICGVGETTLAATFSTPQENRFPGCRVTHKSSGKRESSHWARTKEQNEVIAFSKLLIVLWHGPGWLTDWINELKRRAEE